MPESKKAPKAAKVQEVLRLSSQSTFSTIRENTDLPEQTPSPGRQVLEERGVATITAETTRS